jgi:hypothetical protein
MIHVKFALRNDCTGISASKEGALDIPFKNRRIHLNIKGNELISRVKLNDLLLSNIAFQTHEIFCDISIREVVRQVGSCVAVGYFGDAETDLADKGLLVINGDDVVLERVCVGVHVALSQTIHPIFG